MGMRDTEVTLEVRDVGIRDMFAGLRESDDQAIERLHRSLTNQPPKSEDIVDRFESLRIPAKQFGEAIVHLVPYSRERSLAITKLEEAVMWAIKGIALNQEQIIAENARLLAEAKRERKARHRA